ncbi:MAG: type II toxin-antitoxin system VapC family toxin [Candidatus Bathyarchaeia archaeon]
MIVLDTDVLIEVFDKKSVKGDEVLRSLEKKGEDIAITVINLHEILYGLKKYAHPVKEVLLLPVLDFTKRDAVLSADLELRAEEVGLPIRRADAMIAAITMNRGATLYTFDQKHFEPLKRFGLKLFLRNV